MYYDAQKDELIDLNQRILGEQYREEEIFGEFCKFVEKKLPGFTSNPQNLANLQDMFRQDYNLFEMGYEASQINSLIDAYTEFLDSPFGTTYGRIRVFYFHQDAGLCIYGYRDYIGNGSSVYLYDVEKQGKTPLISNYLLLDFLSSAPTFNRDNSLMFVTFPKFEGFSCYNNGSGDETCVGNYEGEEVFMVYLDGSQTIKLSNYRYACSQIYISSDEKFAYYKLYKEDKKNLLIPGARQENNTMQTAPDQDTDTWVFCSLEEPGRTFMATGNVIRFEQEDNIVVLEQNGIQHEYATDTGSRLN